MPFGLQNAPALFQQMVDGVLASVSDCSGCYIDDVLIYTRTWEEHLSVLRKILNCIRDAGLTVKMRKCVFGKRRLRYLGHMIGEGDVCVPEDRVTAVSEWPMPTTKRQLKRFLGTAGYYRRFIPDFAVAAATLTPLTGKGALYRLVWTRNGESAFNVLKMSFCRSIVLCVPTVGDEFVLYTDASAGVIGGCFHVCRGDQELPAHEH